MNEAAPPWLGSQANHYENFPVGSVLVPSRLRPAVAALYRFARYADDVADEGDVPESSRLSELSALRAAVADAAGVRHPIVEQLRPHVVRHRLDCGQLIALLSAFEQDVTVKRYADRAAVLDYCSRSANPVGRLMLQLFEALDARTAAWSDAICSALQLINFLQDVAIDWGKGRVYLPLDRLAVAGLDAADIGRAVDAGHAGKALRDAIRVEATFAGRLLESGRPLCDAVPRRLAWELRLILSGGQRILDKLAAVDFDPIARRPRIGPADLPAVLLAALRPGVRP